MIRTVAVVGEIYSANLGDYAIYKSVRLLLEEKGYRVVPIDLSLRMACDTSNNEKIKRRPAWVPWIINNLSLLRKLKVLASWKKQAPHYKRVWSNLLLECDAVIIGGGQLLTDNMLYFPPRLRLISEIAGEQDKPVAVFGCGVGKNLGWLAQRMHRELFDNCTYISVRDRVSATRIKSYSQGTDVHVSPDPAFALPSEIAGTNKRELCGLNVISIDVLRNSVPALRRLSLEQYGRFWLNAAAGLKALGMKSVVMTNGNVKDHEDSLFVYDFLKEHNIDISMYDRPENPQMLFNQIATLDFMVSSRMHAGIISFSYGKPVATLAWDDKVPAVWEEIGVENASLKAEIILSSNPWLSIHESLESTSLLLDRSGFAREGVRTSLTACLNALERAC